ncbi:hypothetical protein ACFL7M_17545 [Thermodesulfobacteriota bacterium]
MDKPLTVLTVLREIRRELDEWEWGDQRAKKPDEILSKYLEWVGTDLVNETISILGNMENHSIVKLVAESFEMSERDAFWLCLGLNMGSTIGECLGENPGS